MTAVARMLQDPAQHNASIAALELRPSIPPEEARAGKLAIGLVAAYTAAGAVTYAALHNHTYVRRLLQPDFLQGLIFLLPVSLIGVMLSYRLSVRDNGQRIVGFRPGWAAAWRAARRGAFSNTRLKIAGAVFALTPLFFNTFIAWKVLIPVLHPFAYDATFADLDNILHNGPPDRLLTFLPLQALDSFYYYVWLEVMLAGIFVFAWRAELRALLAFGFAWVLLGTIAATAFSSAGPCYYAWVTGHSAYNSLLERLATANHGAPLHALEVQQGLWRVHLSGALVAGTGISAFPSMHVGVAATLMFASWRRSRVLGSLMTVYTLTVLVASVALGWHYASDGYAAVLGAAVIWWGTGRLVSARRSITGWRPALLP